MSDVVERLAPLFLMSHIILGLLMLFRRILAVAGAFLASTIAACYHATIETGLPPSAQTVEKAFAAGWIYGLIPPSTVSTMAKCPSGVAKVETKLSFANQLVSFLTLSIFTPMNIKVTCAAGRSSGSGAPSGLEVRSSAPTPDWQSVFSSAADTAAVRGSALVRIVR